MFYDDLFRQALKSFDCGDFTSAEAFARQILQTSPDNPDILNLLGLTAQAQGLHQEACSWFSAAIRQKKDEASFYFNLAFSLKANGEYADALNNFMQVVNLAPQIKETYNEIACIYETLADLPQARQYWQTALSFDHDYSTAAINLANSYRQDNPSFAATKLKELSEQYPKEVLVFYDLAWLNYNQSHYQNALTYALKAIELSPNSDAVNYILGLIYLELEQTEQAKKCFIKAEEINADNYEAKLCLADILSRSDHFSEAEQRYRRLIELDAKRFEPHNNYAEMLYRQKRLAEALEEYRKAVILRPDTAETSNNLGVVLKDLGQYQQASDLFINALRCDQELVAASVNLSETLILLFSQDEKIALQIAKNWLKSFSDDQFARHINAAFEGGNIENNQIFVEKLFDNFADNYELVMQNLDYQAPLAIRRIAGDLKGRIADLGCGSGLVGQAVKNNRNQLIGVDLSAKMLKQAKNKQIYTELVQSDLFDFLKTRSDYDWIIAADVLGYIQSVEKLIELCRGKNIIFSIEKSDASSPYQLQTNGRLKHNPSYIKQLLEQNGFKDIQIEDIILRSENSIPVTGCIFKAIGAGKRLS